MKAKTTAIPFFFHFIFFSLYRFLISPFFFTFLLSVSLLPKSFPFFSKRIKKVKALVSLKNSFFKRLSQFERKNSHSKCIWFHCASGEFEYAKPVIKEIKGKHKNAFILVTYFSPSYERFIRNFSGVDMALSLPWDFPAPIESLIKKLHPQLLFIARTDLWPEMLYQCKKRNIPCFLFSSTCPSSAFNFWLFHLYSVWIHSFLSGVFCVSEEDKRNLQNQSLFESVFPIGDTRYDQVIERLRKSKEKRSSKNTSLQKIQFLKSKSKLPYLIAGSTWREDEKVLLEALHSFVKQKKLRMIIAPHEPSSLHLQQLSLLISKYAMTPQRLSLLSLRNKQKEKDIYFDSKPSIFILDQVGPLAEAYLIGDLAFVGGSFQKSVHSVMEPLAAGCLTLVGPYHKKNREVSLFQNQILKEKSFFAGNKNENNKIKCSSSSSDRRLFSQGKPSQPSLDSKKSLRMLYTFKNSKEIKHFLQMYLKNFNLEKNLSYKEQIVSQVKKQAGATSRLLVQVNSLLSTSSS